MDTTTIIVETQPDTTFIDTAVALKSLWWGADTVLIRSYDTLRL